MIEDGPANPNAMPASLVVVEHWFEELILRVPTITSQRLSEP
jgi:hypothetical protein